MEEERGGGVGEGEGAVGRSLDPPLPTHQCGLCSNPVISKLYSQNTFIISICGLNLLLSLVFALGGSKDEKPLSGFFGAILVQGASDGFFSNRES